MLRRLPQTDRAKRVFAEAEALASARGRPPGAADVLHALARCDIGAGRMILERLGIDLEAIQDESAGIIPASAAAASDGIRHLLALAQEEAEAMKHGYLGTEHLVLALLKDQAAAAGDFLRQRGATLEAARNALCAILYGENETDATG